MTTPAIWIAATLLAVAVIFTLFLLFPAKGSPSGSPGEGGGGLSVRAEGSLVTVRKVGRVTSVVIREQVHDHMEGGGSIGLPPLPIEVTRREEPALYAEYVSPDTSAVRRYEIADDLYGKGYTLPWVRGMDEQYRREVKDALEEGGPDARTIHERTPVNLTRMKGTPAPRELDIDHSLRDVPQPPMDGGSPGEEVPFNE